MKLNIRVLLAAVSIAATASSQAAVTITFNAAFAGGVSSNLANNAGVVSNGMFYGIIVDGNGNGIGSTYDAIDPILGGSFALTVGGLATDDFLFFASDLTADTTALLEGDFTTTGGSGSVSGVAFNFSGAAGAGDSYSLVWFDPNGVNAGALSNAAFVVPADGNVVTHDSPFVGVDPIRAANNITFVPEPSVALLGLFGAIGFLRRRR